MFWNYEDWDVIGPYVVDWIFVSYRWDWDGGDWQEGCWNSWRFYVTKWVDGLTVDMLAQLIKRTRMGRVPYLAMMTPQQICHYSQQ